MLCKTEWSWELRTWSHMMNLLDILSTSPHYFCRKWIEETKENSNCFYLRVLKGQIFPIISTEEVLLIMKLFHYSHRMRTQSYYYLRLCFLDRFKLAWTPCTTHHQHTVFTSWALYSSGLKRLEEFQVLLVYPPCRPHPHVHIWT